MLYTTHVANTNSAQQRCRKTGQNTWHWVNVEHCTGVRYCVAINEADCQCVESPTCHPPNCLEGSDEDGTDNQNDTKGEAAAET